MGTEQPAQLAPWGAGGEGMFARFTEDGCCRAVSHTQLDATPRGSDVAPRQGVTVAAPVQTGSHRTRPAFVREGFQRRRAPESHSPLPSPGPASVPCLPPPGATFVSRLPGSSKRTEKPGPWVLARGSLGACAAVAGQSALFGFPSAFVTAAVDPVTPPLGLPAPPRPSQPLPALLPSRGSSYSGLGAALRCGFCGLVPPWGSRSFSSL